MKICVVGGGSAGWITLSYLVATIDADITIVHSDEVDPIGVGESTTPTIKHVADTVGVNEKEWMKDAKATFKYGVEFHDWVKPGSRWLHSFDDMIPHQSFNRPITENGKELYKKELTSVDYYLKKYGNTKDSKYFNESHGPQEHLLANNLSPKDKNFKTNISEYPGYSYHINAFQFGESLRKHTSKDKFTEIVGTVNKIHTDKQNISAIELSTGQKIEADIFFDCTGFKRLLIGTMSSWKHYDELINDRAIWGTIKTQSCNPVTSAHAQPYGWIWEIPTIGQIGSGYVYSSKHQKYDDALQTITDFWKQKGHEFKLFKSVEFDAGMLENVSKHNVVSNGLAQSFIEPLEATSIMVTCVTVKAFVDLYKKDSKNLIKAHDKVMRKFIDHTKRFVHMHYRLSERNDTSYWKEVANDPTALQELCDYIDVLASSKWLSKGETLLNQWNWTSLLLGFNKPYINPLKDITDEQMENYLHYTKLLIENYKHLLRNNYSVKDALDYIAR